MSYSRWSHSRWYTFHHVFSGDKLDDQLFAIYDTDGQAQTYTYNDLLDVTAPGLMSMLGPYTREPTMDELYELMGYIGDWLCDMREEFAGESGLT